VSDSSLAGIEAVLVDLDGVLYVEDEPVPGAAEAVSALHEGGLALRFVTNTTARSKRQTLERLQRLGFEVAPEELVTPAALARAHCERAGHARVALIMNEDVKEDFEGLTAAEEAVDAVIMGDLGEAFGFPILNHAFRLVMEGAELIALQKNRFWMTPHGLSLDAGPFVAAVEYATGREALVVGKPARAFFELVLGDLGVPASAAAMIGDDVETDVGGAIAAGLAGVLVRTGKYREDFVTGSGIVPTATIDSIADLPARVLPGGH
jgi:HAD superfamily hydrolase (TIGR01458 family)